MSLAIAIAAFEQSYKNILIDINDKDRQGLRDRQLPFKIFAMMQHNCQVKCFPKCEELTPTYNLNEKITINLWTFEYARFF